MMSLKPLAWLFCLTAAAALSAPPRAALADEGQAAFAARCGGCHEAGDLRAWARKRPDAAAREEWLMTFLSKHHAPPEAQRKPIVTYIQATIASASAPK